MWEVSPCRRVLIENCALYYAFGNTKHVSLYRENEEEENKLLLLGFGDVRNVLSTAADCAARGRGACRALSFELCDHSLANVARGLLLLHLAGTVDPSSPEDLDFLWGVWYCLTLSDAHAARLAAAVLELLERSAECGPRAALPDAAQAAAVERALRAWLQPAPGVQALRAERRALQASRVSARWGRHVGPAELQEYYAAYATQALSGLLPPPRASTSADRDKALVAECVEFLASGSVYREGAAPAGAANPTLLQPDSRKWLMHYSALPFLGYFPLDPAKHPGVAAGRGPRALTQACLSELAALVRGWQAGVAARRVCWRLQWRDALALCADLQQGGGGGDGDGGGGGGGGSRGTSGGFDVIDTSNLSDHVGLLNVLALAGPLLRRTPHARLFTGHMLWISGGVETLHEYVRLACGGADPQLLPTLLGLRLLDDPLYGLHQPRNAMAGFGRAEVHDRLEWAPAPLAPAVPPAAAPGDGVTAALAGWGSLACLGEAAPPRDRSGLHLLTPLTLLHLVAGLGGRARALLPTGAAASWRQLADALADACGVPETHHLALRALCCWSLRQPGQPGPLLATGRVPLSLEYRQLAQEGSNVLLSLHLAALPRGGGAAGLPAAVQRALAGGLQNPPQAIDVLGFDVETEELSFLLPPDHGLDPEGTGLALVSPRAGLQLSSGPFRLADLRVAPFDRPPPAALAAGLRRLLAQPGGAGQGGSGSGSGGGGGGGGATLSKGVALRQLSEHANRYEVELVVDEALGGSVSSRGLQLAFPGAPPGGGACHHLEVTLAQPATLRAALAFGWPFDSSACAVRVRRGARAVSATLPKTPLWPGDATSCLSKMEVERLPAWADVDALRAHLGCQYSHPEHAAKQEGATLGATGSTMYDVKESVQALFAKTLQARGWGCFMHSMVSTASTDRSKAEIIVFVHGGGILRLPDGRPLLHISYVDHQLAMRMFPTMESRQAPLARFGAVMRRVGGTGPTNQINCTPDELRLLRFVLSRNAAAMQVPSWQRRLLELPSEWQASFVVPLYSDYVVPPDKADAVLSDLPRQAQQAQARLGAAGDGGNGGWAARADPVAAAKQQKEQGNAEFRAGRFGVAANHYSEAVSALQRLQRERPRLGTQQRQLLVDCLNNLAFALTKQADAQPAAAAELLRAAEAACTQALQADVVNSKALYRRASVRQRQGRLEAAQADLRRIRGSGDTAVEALRQQVEAALRV